MEYFDNDDWVNEKFIGKKPISEQPKKYDIGDDMANFKKINEHISRMIPSDLDDEIKQFRKLHNKLKYGNDLTQEDRDFFKLFHETLENLYSNIGQIINHVYEISEEKHN